MLYQTPNFASNNPGRKQRRLAKKNAKKSTAKVQALDPIASTLKIAIQLGTTGQIDDAKKLFCQLTATQQNNADVQYHAGVFFELNKMTDLAYDAFKNAITLDAKKAEYWIWFGKHLDGVGQSAATVIAYQHACALRPNDPDLLCRLAEAYSVTNDLKNTLVAIDAAIAIRPDHARSHLARAINLSTAGKFEQSYVAFYKALELDPEMGSVYYYLSRFGAEIENAADVLVMLKDKLPSINQDSNEYHQYLFTIAELENRQKNYDGAFGFYIQANKAVFDRADYNIDNVMQELKVLQESFGVGVFDALSDVRLDTELPVFIVGMTRSGTTLVEQVIASHSQAAGVGEVNKMGMLAGNLVAASAPECIYPRNVLALNGEGLREMGREYVAFLRDQLSGDWRRIVDKMPFNFVNIGLIKIMFPKAAIIHCKRDPMDTCLSNYMMSFSQSGAMGFSYDMETLGKFYLGYERLMEHWHEVLPGQILDVKYEDMVANPERVSRDIIAHIGLDWEDSCLDFHVNAGEVQTASAWQVRQPIYKTSVERWRRYEKYLGPLQEALENG